MRFRVGTFHALRAALRRGSWRGRWSHQDPKLDVSVPVSYNLYAYAGDDPVNAVDPTGDGFREFWLGLRCWFAALAALNGQLPEKLGEAAKECAECIYDSDEDLKHREEAEEVGDAFAEGDSEEVAELALSNIEETLVEIEVTSVEITIAEDSNGITSLSGHRPPVRPRRDSMAKRRKDTSD